MTADIAHLNTLAGSLYRRHFVKADSRSLWLYGYEPHDLEPLAEEGGEPIHGGSLRWHPLRQEWNVYASHRQNRTFKPSAADDPLAPSKPGGAMTEIPFADFELAIFDNKFPSFHPDVVAPAETIPGMALHRPGGKCEVVVYTPAQEGSLATIGQERRLLLVAAWIDRYEALFAEGHKFVLPFESRGEEVGVTLHHPHGQIYAFDVLPPVQQNMTASFREGYDLATEMVSWGERYEVTRAGGLRVVTPPFARFPYETWIVAEDAVPGPWAFSTEQVDAFAHLLGDMTRRYDSLFGRPTPYMLSLQAAPVGEELTFQFTTQFYPLLRSPDKVKYLASVEQSTGLFTIDIMPEQAAAALKDI
ncbi:galactose-1-phosphate uridylyltransferase [Parvularcula flava]|uniref:Galactose-1-phosphate uridylyltransferase n=1 Tax=Aquisalinus luteolus TaxID=1566827 RepID=A0A8J3A027_9PROT|nr:galactose-1-phosphate uridylyltransferase [Aquisalinus luteolus]NHK26397.1 galactose-1-phosphate uridylyltransferase [Aquisalinus luteolus]GGH92214.1 galactose-1-phosphate uridylyltransferase [Aquisalinus luteolus]